MNLLDYGRILIRRGWIIVLLAVVAGAASYGFSTLLTPVYRSTQTILMVPIRSDFGLTQAAVQLLNSRVAYLTSDLVAQQIIDSLQLDMTPGELRSRTTITAVRDNLTIQFDVDMPAPDDVAAARLLNPIAEAWGQALVQYQTALNQEARAEDRVQARPQDNARTSLLRPDLRLNTLIGALAGLFVGALIVFVLEFFESGIVRGRSDLERDGIPVLAVVADS